MGSSQSKNTIVRVGMLFLFLIIGSGVFGMGLFWPLLLGLFIVDQISAYLLSFFIGIFLSVLVGDPIGEMNILLVLGMFFFGEVAKRIGRKMWLVFLFSLGLSYLQSVLLLRPWQIWEVPIMFLLIKILFSFGYFDSEIRVGGK